MRNCKQGHRIKPLTIFLDFANVFLEMFAANIYYFHRKFQSKLHQKPLRKLVLNNQLNSADNLVLFT